MVLHYSRLKSERSKLSTIQCPQHWSNRQIEDLLLTSCSVGARFSSSSFSLTPRCHDRPHGNTCFVHHNAGMTFFNMTYSITKTESSLAKAGTWTVIDGLVVSRPSSSGILQHCVTSLFWPRGISTRKRLLAVSYSTVQYSTVREKLSIMLGLDPCVLSSVLRHFFW